VFILGRALQGASAAMVGSVALALICDTVPKQNIGRAMGYVTIGTGVATVLAPVLGGLVFDRAGYTAVFAMAFGFIGLDLFLRLVMIEKRDALRWETQTPPDIELSAQNPSVVVTAANKDPRE
jgi:MFS family permease